jgi:hypothetical protein
LARKAKARQGRRKIGKMTPASPLTRCIVLR